MRITTSMMTNTFLGDMNVNLNNMSNRQKQLNTGKEFSRPSDSPYKAARSMQMYSEIYSNEQYNTNISHTVNWLDTTDTAMNSLGNALTRIRELMVSAGNGSYGEDELKSIKDEISEKTNEISQILNTSFDGKYIFGGTKGEKPTSIDGTGNLKPDKTETVTGKDLTRQGDTLKVEISQGVVIDYSINADEILKFQKEGDAPDAKTGDLSELLQNIVNNLNSGDVEKITGENLKELDSAISNMLSVRSKVGTLQNRMEGAETINKSQNTNLKEILSHNEDIDWVEKSMEMATVQTIYMASLQSSARILQNSLLDYVR